MAVPDYYAIKKTSEITSRYLNRGKDLLRRLSATTTPDSTLPLDIATWIIETIDEILPLMPNDYPDYGKLVEIKTQYMDSQSILRTSAKAEIYTVIQNLRIAHECTIAAMNADYKNIPTESLAHMNYKQLKRLSDYVKEQLIGKLKGREDGSTSRTAILNIYGRICLWILSMMKLDGPENCLALAASVRSILESYVDLNLIAQDKIADGPEKYFTFPNVEKWRSAKIIVNMRKQFQLSNTNETTQENSDGNIEALRARLWGKTKEGKVVMPKHWTNQDLRQRVELLHDKYVLQRNIGSRI